MKIKRKEIIFIFFIYYGVFWSWLQYDVLSAFSYFKYIDELIALIALPLFFLNSNFKLKPSYFRILVFLLIFIISGILSNLIYGITDIKTAFGDLFLNIKFFLCCYTGFCIFRENFNICHSNTIKFNLDLLTVVHIILFVVDRLFQVFPIYEIRFKIPSTQLIYPHPTYCAAAIFLLLICRIIFNDTKNKRHNFLNIILCIVIFSTLRFKAIASVIALIAIMVATKYKCLRKYYLLLGSILICIILFLARKQIYFYFVIGLKLFPRGILLITSLKIAIDYFPFGTGFGTFGSYLSAINYSPVYYKYGINHIEGISPTIYNAVTDQYWPMILGQAGIIGLIAMLLIWLLFLKYIINNKYLTDNTYVSCMGIYLYVLISSTSESAICNPIMMPLAFILGVILSILENNKTLIKRDFK